MHRVLKLFALALVAITNFFYPWKEDAKTNLVRSWRRTRVINFFSQPASNLFKPHFTPAIPTARASAILTMPGVHIPTPGMRLNTHTPPGEDLPSAFSHLDLRAQLCLLTYIFLWRQRN